MRSFSSGRGVSNVNNRAFLARRRRKGRACVERAVIEALEELGSFAVSSGSASTVSGGPVVLNQDTHSLHFGSPSGWVLLDNVQLVPMTFSAPGLDSSQYDQNHVITIGWSAFAGASDYAVE